MPDDAAGRPVFRVVVIYGVFAGLWILFSDRAMEALFTDPAQIVRASMIKGWLFVAVTTVLLYGLMRQMVQRLQVSHRREIDGEREKSRALDLLAAIADSADDAIFAKDLEGRYILFNRAAERMSGTTRAVALGRDDTAVFPPETAASVQAKDREILAHGAALRYEECIPGPQGMLTLEVTKIPLRDAAQRIFGICGIARDVTQRKQAEDTLRASELRFHDIVRASADWVWEVDAAGRYTYVSDSVFDLLGYTPDEVLGRTPFDFMPPEEAERVRAKFSAIAAQHELFRDLDNISRCKDGRLVHVMTNGMPILDAKGNLLGYRGLDRDVTEQKQAERELRETRNRLSTLINTIPDLIWLKDTDGRYLACNRRFEQFFGASEADILGKTDYDFVPRELADFFRAKDQAAIEVGGSLENEEEVTYASDGHQEYLQTVKTPFYGSDGHLVGVLGIARNISARKAAENELRQRNAELERFNKASVGRELDMLEMKQRINALSRELGRAPPYPLDFLGDEGHA